MGVQVQIRKQHALYHVRNFRKSASRKLLGDGTHFCVVPVAEQHVSTRAVLGCEPAVVRLPAPRPAVQGLPQKLVGRHTLSRGQVAEELG